MCDPRNFYFYRNCGGGEDFHRETRLISCGLIIESVFNDFGKFNDFNDDKKKISMIEMRGIMIV